MRHLPGFRPFPRRHFLALSAATLTGALARWTVRGARAARGRQEPAGAAGRVAAASSASPEPAGRVVFPLNRGWLYGGRAVPGGTAPEFDDAGFARVTLPHTSWPVPWHAFDDRDYQFVSLYRRHFTPPATLAGRRLFADFAGVMAAATVWLNGVRLAEHRGGHVPFSVELTAQIRWGADNVLAVEVDSTERADIPPFGGALDFLTFGGIYREVALRAVPGTFIADVFARPGDVLGPSRHLDVRCSLASDGGEGAGAPLRLAVALRDGAAGRTLATAEAPVALAAAGPTDVVLRLDDLGAVELWDLDRPTL
ncbi:MAG TPA: hypothetical protein VFW96_15620, partial [Thermomicrobiales bacterium]|nr:hypothetical protein [Thermomicrobiales bacterium]